MSEQLPEDIARWAVSSHPHVRGIMEVATKYWREAERLKQQMGDEVDAWKAVRDQVQQIAELQAEVSRLTKDPTDAEIDRLLRKTDHPAIYVGHDWRLPEVRSKVKEWLRELTEARQQKERG